LTSRAYQVKGMPFVLHSLFPAPTILGYDLVEKVLCDMKTDPSG
jgi:hypothetical protein